MNDYGVIYIAYGTYWRYGMIEVVYHWFVPFMFVLIVLAMFYIVFKEERK